jgi:hypothetical protein
MKSSITWDKHPSINRRGKYFYTYGARNEGKGVCYVTQSTLSNLWEYQFNEGSIRAGYLSARAAMKDAEKEILAK